MDGSLLLDDIEALSEVDNATKDIKNARVEVANAEMKVKKANSDLEVATELGAEISKAEVDLAKAEVNLVKAKVNLAKAGVASIKKKIDMATSEVVTGEKLKAEQNVAYAKAEVDLAKAEVELAKAEVTLSGKMIVLAEEKSAAAQCWMKNSNIIYVPREGGSRKGLRHPAERAFELAENELESAITAQRSALEGVEIANINHKTYTQELRKLLALHHTNPADPIKIIEMETGVNLTDMEVRHLKRKPETMRAISAGTVTSTSTMKLVLNVRNMIKTQTRAKFQAEGSLYLFDGPVPGAYGQGDTMLQLVYLGCEVLCAKVGHPNVLKRQIEVCKLVSEHRRCSTVMPLVDSFEISSEGLTRMAMITPYYAASVSQAFVSLTQTAKVLVESQIQNIYSIFMCTLKSISVFQNKGLCHGDVKPSNLMLDHGLVVLIDFGACVKYGELLHESSIYYGLDCSAGGSLEYDMTCLATALSEVALGSLVSSNIKNRVDLLSFVYERIGEDHCVALMIKDCLAVPENLDLKAFWKKWIQFGQKRWSGAEHMKAVLDLDLD